MNDVMIFARDEQETTISLYRYDDMVEVYTSDSTVITKLNKVVATENIDVITTDGDGRITSAIFWLKPRQLSFRKDIEPSQAQIEARREMMAKINANRKSK